MDLQSVALSIKCSTRRSASTWAGLNVSTGSCERRSRTEAADTTGDFDGLKRMEDEVPPKIRPLFPTLDVKKSVSWFIGLPLTCLSCRFEGEKVAVVLFFEGIFWFFSKIDPYPGRMDSLSFLERAGRSGFLQKPKFIESYTRTPCAGEVTNIGVFTEEGRT